MFHNFVSGIFEARDDDMISEEKCILTAFYSVDPCCFSILYDHHSNDELTILYGIQLRIKIRKQMHSMKH